MKETVDFSKLINDAISGDNSAFEKLYQLTSKTAYQTASFLLKSREDIEDVLQNSYIKAYQKLPELKNPESFESWIKTIVENECKNYIKKEQRIHAPIIFFKNKADEHSEEWKQPVPQEYMEREELRKSISDILDLLSPEVRTCIILFHFEDKNLNEISEILNIPLGTVKSRLHNGRKQIEKEFDKLRKKDPTLFGIGAIPVILSLLSYQAENIVVPAAISESIIASVSGAASTAGAASAAGTTAAIAVSATSGTSAASSVAATAAASIAVKATAIAVAGSVAVGGTVAVKKHIDNKIAESTTIHSTTYKTEESCTVPEIITEILTTAEFTSLVSSTFISTTEPTSPSTSQNTTQTTAANSTIQASKTATQKQTTAKASTTATKPTTTLASTTTTKHTTTTAPSTTIKETTTQKITTTKPTTTNPPTTSPENNYSSSGGVITEYTGSDSNVSIPSSIGSNSITAIGSGAFAGNTDIKSVSLPSSVTQIGQEAFADCTSLTSVSLPSSLEQIGIGAFYGCTSLTDISVPNGTITINDEAFAQCSSLQTITIPASVTSISDDAFDGCGSLTIRCKEGSAAHDFAVANGINFSLI
ncbi:MAG: sigma-70 family RNA polymerase sigma factor [Clostridia bacterium]|nr:sigma-70 family RNA polymerase sigma factor [Clostridia bacterium]